MALLGWTTTLTLFCGICLWFPAGSRSASVPRTGGHDELRRKNETRPTAWDPPPPTLAPRGGSVSGASESTAVTGGRSDSPRVVTTVAADARPSHNATVSRTVEPTGDTWTTTATAETPAASSATLAASTPWTAKRDATSDTAPAHSTPRSVPALTTGPTSRATLGSDPTSWSSTRAGAPATRRGIASTSQPASDTTASVSTTPTFPARTSATGGPSTSTSANSTTPAGIWIPGVPRGFPTPSATTSGPRAASKSPPGTEVPPCASRSMAKRCLVAIASLAALAAVFMVCTVVLCTKLSARKRQQRLGRPTQSTEMMCISALLPEERSYGPIYTRERHPITNGVLVMPRDEDSDEDGGDNLTLSSFLPENDRSG